MTAENHRDTEAQILAAAEELFLERGFALTSTTMIAKKAGCTQALIHYYFRTKDRLVEAVLKQKVMLFLSIFTRIDGEERDFEGRIRRKIESHFDVMMENPRLPFLILNEIASNPERAPLIKRMVEELPRPVFDRFAAELRAEIAAGRVRPMESADLLITLISLNAMLFLAQPVLTAVFDLDEAAFKKLALHRREEHVAIIMRSLKP